MPRTISGKLTFLAGACALSLAFAPDAIAAGGGGHMGGAGVVGRPIPAPAMNSHAPFHQLNGNASSPQPGSTNESSHAPQSLSPASRPEPVTGTRIPSSASQHIERDPSGSSN